MSGTVFPGCKPRWRHGYHRHLGCQAGESGRGPFASSLGRQSVFIASARRAADPSSLADAAARNRATLARLRRDDNEDALWQSVLDDEEKGRVAAPVPVASLDLSRVLLTPRFSVVQGPKVRPIDDASASGINSRTRCRDRMRHDTVDMLAEVAATHVRDGHGLPHFWKALEPLCTPGPRICLSSR